MLTLFTASRLQQLQASASRTGGRKVSVLAFVLFLLASGNVAAQLSYATVPPTSNASSNNMRAPMTSAPFQRSAALYRASEMNGLAAGMDLKSIGFSIDTAATGPVTGNIRVYLVNTTDVTFSRALSWSSLISTPTAMTMVYDGNLTIPANTGFYDIIFTTPFSYTGGGVYMAFEWETTTPDTESAWYLAENSLPNGVASAAAATAYPAVLAASAFRPFIRLGYTPQSNDVAVRAVKALGKLPNLTATVPAMVGAMVVNTGASAISNLTFTLEATGANTYSGTSTLASLAVGDTTMVMFSGFTPTTTGATTLTVTAPADDLLSNNSASWTMTVTNNTISHIPAGTTPTSSVGYNTGSGLILNRYVVQSGQSVYVPRVRVMISNNQASIGKTVFGIVLDAAGNMLGRSDDYMIAGGDLGSWVTFDINDPQVPSVMNTEFYVGLGQPASTPGYYPVGTASETVPTAGAYYIAGGAGALDGGVMPSENNSLGRFMMEADLTTTLVSAPGSIVSENAAIYPNPNSGAFTITLSKELTGQAALELVDVTGKTVYTSQISLNGNKAEVQVQNVPAGMYLLRLQSATQLFTNQVVIK